MIALISIAASIYQLVICAAVPETFLTYNCATGVQTLRHEHAVTATECEQIWSVMNDKTIGMLDGNAECHPPCIHLTPGEIIIDQCLSVILNVICLQDGLTDEYRVYFNATRINPLPIKYPKRNHIGIILCGAVVLLVFVILTFLYYNHHRRPRNNNSQQMYLQNNNV